MAIQHRTSHADIRAFRGPLSGLAGLVMKSSTEFALTGLAWLEPSGWASLAEGDAGSQTGFLIADKLCLRCTLRFACGGAARPEVRALGRDSAPRLRGSIADFPAVYDMDSLRSSTATGERPARTYAAARINVPSDASSSTTRAACATTASRSPKLALRCTTATRTGALSSRAIS